MNKLLYGEKRAIVSNTETLNVIQAISRGIIFCHNMLLYEEREKYFFWRRIGRLKTLSLYYTLPELFIKIIIFQASLNQKDKLDKELKKNYELYKKEYYYRSEFDFNNELTKLKKKTLG